MTLVRFAHSEICGSKAMCASPQLIAACHVLHRLPVPRHPPCALTIFISKLCNVIAYLVLLCDRYYFMCVSHYSAVKVHSPMLKRFYALSTALRSSVTYFYIRSLRYSLVSSPKIRFSYRRLRCLNDLMLRQLRCAPRSRTLGTLPPVLACFLA